MKKSFTLKAFAFGAAATVALAASATPHEFLKAGAEKANQLNTFSTSVSTEAREQTFTPQVKVSSQKAENTPVQKAPIQKAEASYGEWQAELNCEYTFTMLWASERKATYKYQRRDDTANPGDFQIRIPNFTGGLLSDTGVELILTFKKITSYYGEEVIAVYGPEEGVYLNTAVGDGQGNSYPLYYFDHYNWIKQLQQYNSSVTDEVVESWADACVFDENQGLAVLMPMYVPEMDATTAGMAIPWSDGTNYYYETLRLEGPDYVNYSVDVDTDLGYFSHEKDATTGTFNVAYNIHDNNEAWFQILTGAKTGTALQNALSNLAGIVINGETADDVIKVTASSGSVEVPVSSYRRGQYTLLCIARYPGIEEGYFVTMSDNTLRLFDEDLEYYAAGNATFTDATMYEALPVVFGAETYEELQSLFKTGLGVELPDVYTTTVPMQASSTTAGQYRLIHPFAEYYNNYLSDVLYYDVMSDYLTFNAADNQKCFILPSATGVYFPTESSGEIMMVYGSTNQMAGGSAVSADVWGTYANGAITFPETEIPDGAQSYDDVISAISWSQAGFNTTSGAITYNDWSVPSFYSEICKIESTGIAGVENVAADATFDVNAPVEYFNLQGIRVANPEAGQLLIKRQGNKATKVVIR